MKTEKNSRKPRAQHAIDDQEIIDGINNNGKILKHEKPSRITFATRFNRLLDEKAITQTELSKLLRMSTGAISNYRRGETSPSIYALSKMAEHLEVSTDYLVGLSDIKSSNEVEIAINEELGLSDGAINAIKRFKLDSELPLLNLPRMAALNFLLEQELEFPWDGPANPDNEEAHDNFTKSVKAWAEDHTRLISCVADYLVVDLGPKKDLPMTYGGIKMSQPDRFNLLAKLDTKELTSEVEVFEAIYFKRITEKLAKTKSQFEKINRSNG